MKFKAGDKVIAKCPSAPLLNGAHGIFKRYTKQSFRENYAGTVVEVKMLDGSVKDVWFYEDELQMKES